MIDQTATFFAIKTRGEYVLDLHCEIGDGRPKLELE
jgi:hypothetical protein